MNQTNQRDDLWLDVAVEIKKTANASTTVEIETLGSDQYVLKTEKAIIRMIKNDSGIEVRTADFVNGNFWQIGDGENTKISDEITDGEKFELKKNFGFSF